MREELLRLVESVAAATNMSREQIFESSGKATAAGDDRDEGVPRLASRFDALAHAPASPGAQTLHRAEDLRLLLGRPLLLRLYLLLCLPLPLRRRHRELRLLPRVPRLKVLLVQPLQLPCFGWPVKGGFHPEAVIPRGVQLLMRRWSSKKERACSSSDTIWGGISMVCALLLTSWP